MSRKRRGRGEGGIYQRADGIWTASISLGYDEAGKRKRKVIYGNTKKEVQDKLRSLQTDHALGRMVDTNQFTVGDYLTLWLENTARLKTGAGTYDRYKGVVNKQIKPHLGNAKLATLSAFQITQFYATLEKNGESARTRQMTATILYGALRHAVKMKLIVHNPCEDVARPKVGRKEMKCYDGEQVQRFLEGASSDRFFAMYVLAIDTGMRQGELFGLQWPDLNFETKTLQVQRTLQELRGQFELKAPKTEAGRRQIELSQYSIDALHEHRKAMLAQGRDVRNGLVFCDEKGGFLRKSNVTRRSFKAIIKRINRNAEKQAKDKGEPANPIPVIRFHDLRHTCATLLLKAGENIKVVSERLGHEDIEITLKTYSHVMPTMQKQAAEKMNRIFTSQGQQPEKKASDGQS